jgi:hypothetical protein
MCCWRIVRTKCGKRLATRLRRFLTRDWRLGRVQRIRIARLRTALIQIASLTIGLRGTSFFRHNKPVRFPPAKINCCAIPHSHLSKSMDKPPEIGAQYMGILTPPLETFPRFVLVCTSSA